jgi:putative transcriptional regulator
MMSRKMRNRLLDLLTEKERRERRRISQAEIARDIGVSTNTMSHWMQNNQDKLDVSVIERLCDYFQCELGDLLVLEEVEEE